MVHITLIALLLTPITLSAAERLYFIAAEEIQWDYAPSGRDLMMGMGFDEEASHYVERRPDRIGRVYLKAVYREYTDASFTTLKPRAAGWVHLGLLGPVIRAEVGDTLKVVFKNNASQPYSLHAHGVLYDKASEGSPADDGTKAKDKADDGVPPGGTHIYLWRVPERAGPGPADPSSVVWLYHSHVDSARDSNAGLIGPILVTAKGRARPDGSPMDVDRELVTLFTVLDENESGYLGKNIALFADPARVDKADEEFIESNLKHVVNGYLFANVPGLEMKQCERVRWYLLALGTEVDLHTPHWHGNTGLMDGHRVDVVELLPASMKVVDMRADNPGKWMFHCHVNDHIRAGMTASYTVHARDSAVCSR